MQDWIKKRMNNEFLYIKHAIKISSHKMIFIEGVHDRNDIYPLLPFVLGFFIFTGNCCLTFTTSISRLV